MANSGILEVFGPLDVVLPALSQMELVQSKTINRVGCAVLDMGDWDAVLGDEEDDESTFIVVNAADPADNDRAALALFEIVQGVLPYAMEVRAADGSDVLASRAAVSAA